MINGTIVYSILNRMTHLFLDDRLLVKSRPWGCLGEHSVWDSVSGDLEAIHEPSFVLIKHGGGESWLDWGFGIQCWFRLLLNIKSAFFDSKSCASQ